MVKNPRSHENPGNVAIGYVRVSTEEQATEGVSLDAQRAKVLAYCAPHGVGLTLSQNTPRKFTTLLLSNPGGNHFINRVCRLSRILSRGLAGSGSMSVRPVARHQQWMKEGPTV